MSDAPLEIEETDLRAHVQICAQRNRHVAKTLDRIETTTTKKLDRIAYVQWGIVAALLLTGALPLDKLIPLARALAGVP